MSVKRPLVHSIISVFLLNLLSQSQHCMQDNVACMYLIVTLTQLLCSDSQTSKGTWVVEQMIVEAELCAIYGILQNGRRNLLISVDSTWRCKFCPFVLWAFKLLCTFLCSHRGACLEQRVKGASYERSALLCRSMAG